MPLVPLTHLLEWSPFEKPVWHSCVAPEGAITWEEVRRAIDAQRFYRMQLGGDGTRQDHIERVAYLVERPDRTPIHIDVGVPELGHHSDWIVDDGHHRLASAFFRGELSIDADVSGSIAYAEELLGIKMPRTIEERVLEALRRSPGEFPLVVPGLEAKQVRDALGRLKRARTIKPMGQGYRIAESFFSTWEAVIRGSAP